MRKATSKASKPRKPAQPQGGNHVQYILVFRSECLFHQDFVTKHFGKMGVDKVSAGIDNKHLQWVCVHHTTEKRGSHWKNAIEAYNKQQEKNPQRKIELGGGLHSIEESIHCATILEKDICKTDAYKYIEESCNFHYGWEKEGELGTSNEDPKQLSSSKRKASTKHIEPTAKERCSTEVLHSRFLCFAPLFIVF